MHRPRVRRPAVLAALALVVVAGCDGQGPADSGPTTTGTSVTTTTPTATTATTASPGQPVASAPPRLAACPRWSPPVELGRTAPPLVELSGITVGRRNPDLLWVHNDSGDAPRLFAVDRALVLRATVSVLGARAVDWEDVAWATAADGTPWLWAADTGDNLTLRDRVQLYGFAEPAVGASAELSVHALRVDVRYPDGPQDVEAFVVDPRSGEGYLIGKRIADDRTATVYRVAASLLRDGGQGDAVALAPLPWPVAATIGPVAADISADGGLVVVKGTTDALVWLRGPDEDLGAVLARSADCRVRVGTAEALALAPDASALWALNEGTGAPLRRLDRR